MQRALLLLAGLLIGCAPDDAFYVVSTMPSDGATDVDLSQTIEVTLSRPVRPDSLDAESLYAEPAIFGARSTDGSVVSLSPDSPLRYATEYTITLDPALYSIDEKRLFEETQFSFTTRRSRWNQDAETLVVENVSESAVAASAAGSTGLFIRSPADDLSVTWIEGQNTETVDLGRTAEGPLVGDASGDGEVMFAWREADDLYWLRRVRSSGIWSNPIRLGSVDGRFGLGASDDGTATAWWVDESEVWAARYDDGWGTPVSLGPSGDRLTGDAGPAGSALVAWNSLAGLHLAHRPTPTSSWQTEVLADVVPDDLKVVSLGSGRFVIVWRDEDGIQVAERLSTGATSQLAPFSHSGSVTDLFLHSHDGEAFVGWEEPAGWFGSTLSSTWSEASLLDASVDSRPRAAGNQEGDFLTAWTTPSCVARTSIFDGETGWETAVLASETCGEVVGVALFNDETGRLFLQVDGQGVVVVPWQ